MPILFLSHAAADKALAKFCEETLREAIPGMDVFRTTRVSSIPAGKPWLEMIHSQLRAADRVLVLLTPSSVERPWINFETGAAWIADKVLVPGVAGMTKEEVPEPLRSLQLRSLDNKEEAEQAFKELGGTLKDPATFVTAVRTLVEVGVRESLEDRGWTYIDFDGARYAWDGPLDDLSKATPVPLPTGLIEALEAKGYEARSGIPGNLWNEFSKGYKQLFQIDRHNRTREIIGSSHQVMLVRKKGAHPM